MPVGDQEVHFGRYHMRRRLISVVVLACICIAPEALAQPNRLNGKFTGTGRACSGSLVIQAKTISWTSSFSRCQGLPYEMVERSAEAGIVRYSFRFKRISSSCRYRYITVSHDEAQESYTGWGIIGYGSEQSYLADKAGGYKADAEDTISCYLIREGQ